MMRLIVLSAGLASVSGAGYEVWASDQSNSAAGQSNLGVKGSFLWIFDSQDIETQIDTGTSAEPLKCYDSQQPGEACDILEVFPQNLEQYEQRNNGKLKRTMKSLGDLPGFGRLHGVIRDPQVRTFMRSTVRTLPQTPHNLSYFRFRYLPEQVRGCQHVCPGRWLRRGD